MRKEIFISGLILMIVVSFITFFWKPRTPQITDQSATVSNSKEELNSIEETRLNTADTVTNQNSKIISREEVASHNKENDCWIIIEERVYDVTNYINQHPGGRILVNYCGKDGTSAFNARGPRRESHSPKAKDLLKKFYLGNLTE